MVLTHISVKCGYGVLLVRVLLVGGGVRGHVIADNVARHGHELFSAVPASNIGISSIAAGTCICDYGAASVIARYARRVKAGLAIIGPEEPLFHGVTDALRAAGIPVFGPTREHARLEWSKAHFMRMAQKHRIPGAPESDVIESAADAGKISDFHHRFGAGFVIKADGLMSGKGVFVGGDHFNTLQEAKAIVGRLLSRGPVVLQRKLEGVEFSGHYLAGGGRLVTCPYTQDHKRALAGDKGPNTGGMGSYSDADHSLPFLNRADLRQAGRITRAILRAVRRESGSHYTGVLYPAFMKTKDGIRIIEVNCRFGDPESANIFHCMDGDFAKAALAAATGRRMPRLAFRRVATVVRYAVPPGYPDEPVEGEWISLDEHAIGNLGRVYYGDANFKFESDGRTHLTTGRSRTFAIAAEGEDIGEAKFRVDEAFRFVNGRHRRRNDIPDLGKIGRGGMRE